MGLELPSILLVSVDALRYDCVSYQTRRPHLAALAQTVPPTPNLDRLFDRSTHFTSASAHAPYTTVSHASILTGLLPTEHGVRTFMETSLHADATSIAERLRDAGYATLLMSDELRLFRPVGLDRGFDAVTDDLERALHWWQSESRPRFALIHLYDVHAPYGYVKGGGDADRNERWTAWIEQHLGREFDDVVAAARSTGDERLRLRRLKSAWQNLVRRDNGLALGLQWYLAGLRWFDGGRLRELVDRLDNLGVLDESIVAVFGDHGEGHDPTYELKFAHACMMFDDVVRVPLGIRHPDWRVGRTIEASCGLADLAPTLLDLVDVPPIGELGGPLSGRSLMRCLDGGSLPDRPVYGEYWRRRWDATRGDRVAVLRHRMFRWSERKFSLVGRHFDVDDLAEQSDAREFVRRLYGDILGRHPDAAGAARFSWGAKWLGNAGRRHLVRRVARSAEAQRIPKYAWYDLREDPTAQLAHAVAPGTPEWPDVERLLRTCDVLDHAARVGPALCAERDDLAAVEARLQELGYLD